MGQVQSDLKRLQEQVRQIKTFCEAVADSNSKGAEMRDILHKNLSEQVYRKNQPWHETLDNLTVNIVKQLTKFDKRIKKLEEK